MRNNYFANICLALIVILLAMIALRYDITPAYAAKRPTYDVISVAEGTISAQVKKATQEGCEENPDRVVAKAVKLGATQKGPVMDMFWGDRCGTIVDPDGNTWMIATHVSEPTPQEMKKKMKEMSGQVGAPAGPNGRDLSPPA